MKIQDLMTSPAVNAQPEMTLANAARIMLESEIGFLPVTHPLTGALEGVLTDRDICMSALVHGLPLNRVSVAQAMRRSVRSCDRHADLSSAHALMREHMVHRLPVTDAAGRLVGVISIDDLARAASDRLLGHSRTEVSETVGAIGHSHLRT